MESHVPAWTLGALAERLGGQLDGPNDLRIERPVDAGSNDPRGITFAESEKYLDRIRGSQVGAVVLSFDAPDVGRPAIRVQEPRAAFGALLALWERPVPLDPGIHPTAVVHPQASVDPTASVGAYAVIERGATVGPRCFVYPFCFVGDGCVLSEDVVLYPHAVLVQDVIVGARTILHPGVVLGADGFRYVWNGTRRVKVPQVGKVVLEADVEVGANTCIDRAMCGATEIGVGSKLDNLVQVGHNVKVGEHSVIAGVTGIAGSVQIGKRNTIGGHVAMKDHAVLADDVTLAGRTGVFHDIPSPGSYYGTPATPFLRAMKILSAEQKLPELMKRVQMLEAAVERLQEKP